MEAALAQGLVGADTLPPLASQEAMASDDRHPLILLVSAVFWVFCMFRIQLSYREMLNWDFWYSVATVMGESSCSVCYDHNTQTYILYLVILYYDANSMFFCHTYSYHGDPILTVYSIALEFLVVCNHVCSLAISG